MKPIVGLTGGIASGKTTVAKIFAKSGIPIIDADELAREVVKPGTPGLAALAREFGESILNPDGSLNREPLAQIVFNDERALQRINAITHPLIAQAGQKRIAQLQSTNAPFIIYEAALLVENQAHLAFDALVVVDATEENQVQRSIARSQSTHADTLARIRAQASRDQRRAVATYVIDNHGDLQELEQETLRVFDELAQRFKSA